LGKTTLAKNIKDSQYPNGRYLNWDSDEGRQDKLNKRWSTEIDLLIF